MYSMLFEHQASAEGYASCNKMCMAKCTIQRCAGRWEVAFLVSCSHPTGMLVSSVLLYVYQLLPKDKSVNIQIKMHW